MSKVPAVIFGNHITTYGAIRALQAKRVPIHVVSANENGFALKSRFIGKRLHVDPDDPKFVPKLDNWIRKELGGEAVFIVAGDDRFLERLSQSTRQFDSKVHLTFPNWETVQLVRKKVRTYEISSRLGIPTPRTSLVRSFDELKELIHSPTAPLKFPLFMKAERSEKLLQAFGVKGVISRTPEDLIYNYERLDGFFGELILQEVISSKREKIKTVLLALNEESNPTGFLVNQKIRASGEYMPATFVQSDWSDELLSWAVKLCKEIGHYGFASVQFKFDENDNEYKFLEINGRISASNSLATACGTNLVHLMYLEAIGEKPPRITQFKKTYSDRILWWYVIPDVVAYFRYNRHQVGIFEYFKSLIGRKYVLEPFCLRDPFPAIHFVAPKISGFLKKHLKQLLARKSRNTEGYSA